MKIVLDLVKFHTHIFLVPSYCSQTNTISTIDAHFADDPTIFRQRFDSPDGVDVFENELYFMSKSTGAISKIDKFGRGIVKEVVAAGSVVAGTDLKVS